MHGNVPFVSKFVIHYFLVLKKIQNIFFTLNIIVILWQINFRFMLKVKIKYAFVLLLIILIGCAKRGTITGGFKDTIAPVLKASFPKNFSTNFKANEIKLTFDEYVKLKGVNKQLVISPPMKTPPEVLPSNPSKIITIIIKDTLQPDMTYSFNFGQSITDNNEENPYNQFKYVFSTGKHIDSLAIGGVVKDALNKNPDNFVSVMLYEVNSKYSDSIIYKNPPRYITNTLDSLKTFKLENIKAGKYLLVALKDVNNNNLFNPKMDKIGFQKQYVSIPNDTLFELELFKETLPFKAIKPVQSSGNRLILGYEGKPKNTTIELRNGAVILPTIITKLEQKDSLQVWYKPVKVDSLQMKVTNEKYKTDFTFKIKAQKKDTLSFSPKQSGILPWREKFTVNASIPIVKFDNSKIKIIDKDSVAVAFTTEYDDYNQQLKFDFPKQPLQKYSFMILPGALVDLYDNVNDTLRYSVGVKNLSDYGNLRVNLLNIKRFPVLLELTNSKGVTVAAEYSESNSSVDFTAIEPAIYTLRVIYDENKNKEWDAGNFLEKRQSEEVIYFPKDIDVRANWDIDQAFDLGFKK